MTKFVKTVIEIPIALLGTVLFWFFLSVVGSLTYLLISGEWLWFHQWESDAKSFAGSIMAVLSVAHTFYVLSNY